MDPKILIPVLVVVAALIVIAAVLITRQRKSKHLKQQFGPEYDRAVDQQGNAQIGRAHV